MASIDIDLHERSQTALGPSHPPVRNLPMFLVWRPEPHLDSRWPPLGDRLVGGRA